MGLTKNVTIRRKETRVHVLQEADALKVQESPRETPVKDGGSQGRCRAERPTGQDAGPAQTGGVPLTHTQAFAPPAESLGRSTPGTPPPPALCRSGGGRQDRQSLLLPRQHPPDTACILSSVTPTASLPGSAGGPPKQVSTASQSETQTFILEEWEGSQT